MHSSCIIKCMIIMIIVVVVIVGKGTYSGHSDYVHCVCMRSGSSHFLSGSEDGTVRIWGELYLEQ